MVFDIVWALLAVVWLGAWLTGSSVVWHVTGRRRIRTPDRLGALVGAMALYAIPMWLAWTMTPTVGRTRSSSASGWVIGLTFLGAVALCVAAMGSLIMWVEGEDRWFRNLRSICWPAAVPISWVFRCIGAGTKYLRFGILRRPVSLVGRSAVAPLVLGRKIADKAVPGDRV